MAARRLLTTLLFAWLLAAWPATAGAQATAAANAEGPIPRRPALERAYFVRAKLVRTAVVKSGPRNVVLMALEETAPSTLPAPAGFEAVSGKKEACRYIFFLHEAADGDADQLDKAVGAEIDGVAVREKPECGGSLVEWTSLVPYAGLRAGGVTLRAGALDRGTDLSEIARYLEFFVVPGKSVFGRGDPPFSAAHGLLTTIGSKEALELAVRHDLLEPKGELDRWNVPDKEAVFERGLVELGNLGYLERIWQRSHERALELVDKHFDGPRARSILVSATAIREAPMYDLLIGKFASATPELKELTLSLLGGDYEGPDDYVESFLRASIPTTPVKSEYTAKQLQRALQIFDRRRALDLTRPAAFARTVYILSRGQRSFERSRFLRGMRVGLDGVVGDTYGGRVKVSLQVGDYPMVIEALRFEQDAALAKVEKGANVRIEGRFDHARIGKGTQLEVTLASARLGPPKGMPEAAETPDPGPWTEPPGAEAASDTHSGCAGCATAPRAASRPAVALALAGVAALVLRRRRRGRSPLGVAVLACALTLTGCKKSQAPATCSKAARSVHKESASKAEVVFRTPLDHVDKARDASVATDGETVAVADGTGLTAYDASSGKKKWAVEARVSARALAVAGGAVLSVEYTETREGDPPVVKRKGRVVARDASSGSERWSAEAGAVVEGFIVDRGRLDVAASNRANDDEGTHLAAWQIDGGAKVFEADLLEVDCAWVKGGPALIASCPALTYALDRGNGKIHWEKPTVGYDQRVLVANELTAFGGEHYGLEARRIDDAELVWTYKHKGNGGLNRRFAHVYGDTLLIGLYEDYLPSDTPRRGKGTNATRLIGIDAKSGEEIWSHVVTRGGSSDQDRRTLEAMAADAGSVVLAADGGLQALSLCDGTIRELETEHRYLSGLVLRDADVYFIEEPGSLVHLRLR